MSVIISRALPDVRTLETLAGGASFTRCTSFRCSGSQALQMREICGDTSGNYHPHGEAVIYPTLVHMGAAVGDA